MISIPTLVTQLQATGAPESDPAEKPRALLKRMLAATSERTARHSADLAKAPWRGGAFAGEGRHGMETAAVAVAVRTHVETMGRTMAHHLPSVLQHRLAAAAAEGAER